MISVSLANSRSTPRGNSRRLAASRSVMSDGSGVIRTCCWRWMPGPLSTRAGPSRNESTCSRIVTERSGYSNVPTLKRSKGGTSAGEPTNANAAVAGFSTMRAPVWKRNHSVTAGSMRSLASSQIGVSWSHSVSAMAPTPADRGAGTVRRSPSGAIVPGRAVASSTARNVACAASTESAVSYTHLDVYKRQSWDCRISGWARGP